MEKGKKQGSASQRDVRCAEDISEPRRSRSFFVGVDCVSVETELELQLGTRKPNALQENIQIAVRRLRIWRRDEQCLDRVDR
jgi:hypothetical protein